MSYTAQIESIEQIQDEIRPIHLEHWQETEGYRHGIEFNPDYSRLAEYERINQYVLFTLRHEGVLVGNCGIYVKQSMHTQRLVATEDTLFISKAHRGPTSKWFHDQVENALKGLGVTEIRITVKNTNRVGKLLQRWGYKPVAVEMVKVYED